MTDSGIEITQIGRVESALTDPASAPKQGDEGAPDASLVFDGELLGALDGIEPGQEIIVLRRWHGSCGTPPFGPERAVSGPNPTKSPGTRGDRKAKVGPSSGGFSLQDIGICSPR